jgi:hypothetical protein
MTENIQRKGWQAQIPDWDTLALNNDDFTFGGMTLRVNFY